MQKKNKYFYLLLVCLFCLVFLNGCDSSREILLEDSSCQLELFTKKQELEEPAVITGKISDTEAVVIESDSVTNENLLTDEDSVTDATSTTDADMIYVYICGQVVNPGVYQVPSDARVFFVIQMAGGVTVEADETRVNQAQNLVDGQMIYIPAVGEAVSSTVPTSQGVSTNTLTSDKVNINTADLETLMRLPGIGEGKAQSILKYRQENGSFQSIEDIMNVEGIKEGTFSKFKDQITI